MKHRILQIAPTPFFSDRGCHVRIEGVVRCLSELGHENTLCTYHHGRDIETINTKRIKPIAKYTQTAAGPSKYKLLADWRLLLLSISEFRRIKPTVIHAHLHEGLLIGLIVKLLFFWYRTPLIGDMQGSLSGELEAHGAFDKKPYLRRPIRIIEWCLMKCATRLLCSSKHSLEKIKSEFSVSPAKISLAQDGADSASPLSASQRQALIEKCEIPTDKVIVSYSGALLESKGLNELKEVIKGCKDKNVHFLIIGYPEENLQSFIEQEGLQEQCTLTGQIEFQQLSEYLSLADIAIDPKNNEAGEGSGKMLNYLACGLAVVGFNTINNRNFLPA
ncbi:MAG: glycosyltransferase, partial [Acidiferrobacterales bacterium]|nr:glycosyltransferase [Acidiferrobacterales bacterium]